MRNHNRRLTLNHHLMGSLHLMRNPGLMDNLRLMVSPLHRFTHPLLYRPAR